MKEFRIFRPGGNRVYLFPLSVVSDELESALRKIEVTLVYEGRTIGLTDKERDDLEKALSCADTVTL